MQLGFSAGAGPAARMSVLHQHHELELNWLVSGRVYYLFGGQKVSVMPGRLTCFWAARPHQLIEVEGKGTFYWVTLPMAWVLSWNPPSSLMDQLWSGALISDQSAFPGERNMFERWMEDVGVGDVRRQSIARMEIQARMQRLFDYGKIHFQEARGGGVKSVGSRTVSVESPKAVEMARYIAGHYLDPLKASDIATHTGLYVNYASTLFKKTYGITLMDYVLQHRLWHAQKLLASTSMKILDVALESGFGSLSRFYDHFTSRFGISPKAYRRRLETGGKPRRKSIN